MTRLLNPAELSEHLKYEIDMLNECHKTLIQIDFFHKLQVSDIQKWTLEMSLKDSFAVHARCLLEFFSCERNNVNSAKRFTLPSYQTTDFPEKFRIPLNNQISHLIYERTLDSNLKISDSFRLDVMNYLRPKLSYFKQNLKPEYLTITIPEIPQFVTISGPSGPSSLSTSVTTSPEKINPSITGPRPT